MKTRFNFTQSELEKLPLPETGKRFTFHDIKQPGLQLRVTAKGTKSFCVMMRVAGGQPERVTIGSWPQKTIDSARKEARRIINELAEGKSHREEEQAKEDAKMTLREALEIYVAKHLRKKDGLPLKERTKADYLAKLAPGKLKKDGTQGVTGELHALANKPIRKITAADIRAVNEKNLERGERSAAYAMQVLRAVLNYHGVIPKESPFSRETPEAKRILVPQANASDSWIPEESIGAWWNALDAMPDTPTTDYLKFTLLTGCRVSEPLKVLVSDCDLVNGRVRLRDTKNRADHVLALSTQAWDIVKRQAEGKAAADRLFGITDAKRTVHLLVEATAIQFSVKSLRASFATYAEPLVSTYTLKRLMNHTIKRDDVTGGHYVHKGEPELRAGWQAVADFIESQAAVAKAFNVVTLPEVAV